MEWPQPEYHKLYPADVLLDVASLSPLQKSAWFGIWMELHRLSPPGLMKPMDLRKLRAWADLPPNLWDRNCVAILGKFMFHVPSATLHDPKMQANYLDLASLLMRKRIGGKRSAERRNERKIGSRTSSELPATPYSTYTGDFIEINVETWARILKIIEEKTKNPRVLQDSSNTLEQQEQQQQQHSDVNAPPAARGGAGVSVQHDPDISAFLAAMDDSQLAELKRQCLAGETPFHQQHYRDKNPRLIPQLAFMLHAFAKKAQCVVASAVPPGLPESSGAVVA